MHDMAYEDALARAEAIRLLDEWAAAVADRDRRIRLAHATGISKAEIARRMGIHRGTVMSVLGEESEDQP